MKLGASATSPGVTARWRASVPRLPRTMIDLFVRGEIVGTVRRRRGAWIAWCSIDGPLGPPLGKFTHRYQAKRAVEAAVSQALREAVE